MNLKSNLLIALASVALAAPLSATTVTTGQCAGPSSLGCVAALDVFSIANPGTFLDGSTDSVSGLNAQGNVLYTGTLRSAVYRNLLGTLDFYYQFFNSTSSPDSISRITMNSFAGFTTDIGYTNQNIDGNGNADVNFVGSNRNQVPLIGERVSAATVGFNFGAGSSAPKINPGETSSILVIRTNATNFGIGSTSIINGAVANIATFAPAASSDVPEPATYALMGAGLVALGLLRRNRK
jgi:hypothetical protein